MVHGAELPHPDHLPVEALAPLHEEDRPRRIPLDRGGDQREQRRDKDQGDHGQNAVLDGLGDIGPVRDGPVENVQHGQTANLREGAAMQAEADHVGRQADRYRRHGQAADQILDAALGLPGQGDNDLVDQIPADQADQVIAVAQELEALGLARHAIVTVVDKADDAGAQIAFPVQLAGQALAEFAGTENDGALGEAALPRQAADPEGQYDALYGQARKAGQEPGKRPDARIKVRDLERKGDEQQDAAGHDPGRQHPVRVEPAGEEIVARVDPHPLEQGTGDQHRRQDGGRVLRESFLVAGMNVEEIDSQPQDANDEEVYQPQQRPENRRRNRCGV